MPLASPSAAQQGCSSCPLPPPIAPKNVRMMLFEKSQDISGQCFSQEAREGSCSWASQRISDCFTCFPPLPLALSQTGTRVMLVALPGPPCPFKAKGGAFLLPRDRLVLLAQNIRVRLLAPHPSPKETSGWYLYMFKGKP